MTQQYPCNHCAPKQQIRSNDRIAGYKARTAGMTRIEREKVIPALANRNFHLPGYSFCADWMQYVLNNHPVLGICCHHRLHPIGIGMRIVNMVGSIMFGLAVTNIIWLWFILNEVDEEQELITIGVGEQKMNSTATAYEGFSNGEVSVTRGMMVLWTIGGGLHAVFDQTVWFFTACTCCLPGQALECCGWFRKYFHYLVILTVVACTAVASFAVVVRADLENQQGNADLQIVQNRSNIEEGLDELFGTNTKDTTFGFLISYAIELALALFVYNPLVATVLFSGILGCGRIPILGGRPYELRAQERQRVKSHQPLSCPTTSEDLSDPSIDV